ncbi:MAG TPA: hypothetical protein GXZ90_05050 [Clostridiales bacterium]|nr:hypothetical protein [Clostridiales bacterium]
MSINKFGKEIVIKKLQEIMKSINNTMHQVKKRTIRNFTITLATSLIMSSTTFAGEHNVNDWNSYKNAIMEDMLKQDESIVINYKSDKTYKSFQEVKDLVQTMYNEVADDMLGTLEENNVRGIHFKTIGTVKNNVDYKLTSGEYNITYKNSFQDMQQSQTIIDNFLSNNIDSSMSDYEKVKIIYNFVIDKLSYGYANTGDTAQDKLNERNILLGLQGNPVVCEGYSMLFSKMMTSAGYNNKIIRGKVDSDGHSWNLVEIDNQWYHVDATWGDSISEKRQEDYFLTSDDFIEAKDNPQINRTWIKANYPQALEIYNKEIKNEDHIEAANAVKFAEQKKIRIIRYGSELSKLLNRR